MSFVEVLKDAFSEVSFVLVRTYRKGSTGDQGVSDAFALGQGGSTTFNHAV